MGHQLRAHFIHEDKCNILAINSILNFGHEENYNFYILPSIHEADEVAESEIRMALLDKQQI